MRFYQTPRTVVRRALCERATALLLVVLAIIGSPLPLPLFVALVAVLLLLALTVLESLHGGASSQMRA